MGGPPIFPFVPHEILDTEKTKGTWKNQPDGPAVWRRSIYVYQRRSLPFPMFETFDHPDMNLSAAQRNVSTVPTQALTLLNNPFVRAPGGTARASGSSRKRRGILARQIDLGYQYALAQTCDGSGAIARTGDGEGEVSGRFHARAAEPERISLHEVIAMSHKCNEAFLESSRFPVPVERWHSRPRAGLSAESAGTAGGRTVRGVRGEAAWRRILTRRKPPHFAPRAKAVISLFMTGGPSAVDLWDYKPALTKYAGAAARRKGAW